MLVSRGSLPRHPGATLMEAAEGAAPVDPTALFGRMADHVTAAMQREETAAKVLDGWLGS